MKQFWLNLQSRERWTLAVGAVVLTLLLVYLLLLEPFAKEMKRLQGSVQEQQQVLAWMQQAVVEVGQLRGTGARPSRPQGQSLLSLVDGSARSTGLSSSIKRVQPDGSDSVRVWLEQVPFDDLVRWLAQLNARFGLALGELVVEREEQPGLVRARLLIREGGE